MLWFLRSIGAVCALLASWMILHSLRLQLSQRKRLWRFIHTVTTTAVTAYTISELLMGWMDLSPSARIFCAACWILLSICCIFSTILDAFADPDKPYVSLRRFNHDFGSLLISIFVALLPLFPAYLYITL